MALGCQIRTGDDTEDGVILTRRERIDVRFGGDRAMLRVSSRGDGEGPGVAMTAGSVKMVMPRCCRFPASADVQEGVAVVDACSRDSTT